MKAQVHFKIDQDTIDRFRKICITGGFEYSEVAEYLIKGYVAEWDRTLSTRVASYTTGKTPMCECGHEISSVFERCIYCGKYNAWSEPHHLSKPNVVCICGAEYGAVLKYCPNCGAEKP